MWCGPKSGRKDVVDGVFTVELGADALPRR